MILNEVWMVCRLEGQISVIYEIGRSRALQPKDYALE